MNDQKKAKSASRRRPGALIIAAGLTYWYKFHRNVPQPAWITATARDNFLYGSAGAERDAGIPYWIWLVLPRIFPEYLPYPGGYVALGMTWEEGKEMPAGFSKKTVGYVRVAANCALCHAASYRSTPDATPEVVAAIPGHTIDFQPLLTFLQALRPGPALQRRRIACRNRYGDRTLLPGPSDLPLYFHPGHPAGPARSAFVLDATLRAHSQNPERPFTDSRLKALADWVRSLLAPVYPLPINSTLAAAGKPLFAQHCASCHAVAPTTRQGVPPLRNRHGSHAAGRVDRRPRAGRREPGQRAPGNNQRWGLHRFGPWRNLAARAISAQRLSAVATRSPGTSSAAQSDLLSRQRYHRRREPGISFDPGRGTGPAQVPALRYHQARQQQRRPSLRHRAVTLRQRRASRVPENSMSTAHANRQISATAFFPRR